MHITSVRNAHFPRKIHYIVVLDPSPFQTQRGTESAVPRAKGQCKENNSLPPPPPRAGCLSDVLPQSADVKPLAEDNFRASSTKAQSERGSQSRGN